MMAFVFVYTLMCYGLSSALVYYNGPFGMISRFRDYVSSNTNKYLDELFSCMFCLPVNIGMVLSVISLFSTPFTPFTVLLHGNGFISLLTVLFDGFYTGASVSIIDYAVSRLSEKVTYVTPENDDMKILTD